jgi:hypothetical protein
MLAPRHFLPLNWKMKMNPSPNPRRIRKLSAPQFAPGTMLGSTRPVMFELHIRPMFRTLDREHMSFALNFWKYNDAPAPQQQQFYNLILNRLKAADPGVVMPPPNEGGPWPPEWIALFERWITEGMRRLENATADVTKLRALRDPGTLSVTITGDGIKPSADHVVWIERAYDADRMYNEYFPDQFVLYQEQRVASPPASMPFSFGDFFEVPIALTQLTVVDSAGKHVVNIA